MRDVIQWVEVGEVYKMGWWKVGWDEHHSQESHTAQVFIENSIYSEAITTIWANQRPARKDF
jgi:hypothetical protein